MSEDPSAKATYQSRLASRERDYQNAKQRADRLGNLRLFLALVALVLIILPLFLRDGGPWWALIPLFFIFLILGVHQDRAFDRRRRSQAAVRFYQQGMMRLMDQWRSLEDNGEELGRKHKAVHFADDLDLFGEASLFQLFSRTATVEGRRVLASWFVEWPTLSETRARQIAAAELADKLDLRESLVTNAAGEDATAVDDARLLAWAEGPKPIPFFGLLRVIGILFPVLLAISAVVWVVLGQHLPFVGVAVVQIIILVATKKITSERATVLSGPERVLTRYARLIETIEQSEVEAPRLLAIQEQLKTEGVTASSRIRELRRLVNLLDARLNMFFALSIGPATMWDLNLVLRAERWRQQVGPVLSKWSMAIGEFEALASFAALSYERPDYCFPVFDGTECKFVAEGLAHPLIDRSAVVTNDLELKGPGSVLLLSGSNMSGKSTLLRSVGINIVMARAGAPVAARKLVLAPMQLVTSVRIVDSLASGTSHFYAELKRLKLIIDAVEARSERSETNQEESVIYLLDEMLHGTNSRERYVGAAAVIGWLSEQGAMGIVTTHDLALARVETDLPPERLRNMHFSDAVNDGKIAFDYHLQEGPVRSGNALRLMQQIGINLDFESFQPPG